MKSKKVLTILLVLLFFVAAMVGSGEPAPDATEREIVVWNLVSIIVCAASAGGAYLLNRDEIRKAL